MSNLFAFFLSKEIPSVVTKGAYDPELQLWVGETSSLAGWTQTSSSKIITERVSTNGGTDWQTRTYTKTDYDDDCSGGGPC